MRQKNKLTNEELFHFCEQFSILLHSGISCAEGLELMLDDSRTQRGKDFFQLLLTDFEQNGSFSQTLKNSGYFPESMISYIDIGEETGCLDEVLKSLSEHYDQERKDDNDGRFCDRKNVSCYCERHLTIPDGKFAHDFICCTCT